MADYQMKLDAARQAIDAALATYRRERAALTRPDGTAKYGEIEQAERIAALNERLHDAARQAVGVADAELTELSRLVEAQADDPTARLTAAELATAANRWVFVREDAEAMTTPELVARVRGVLAAGGPAPDKVSALLWARATRRRWQDGRRAAAAAGRPFPNPAEQEDWSNLEGLLGRLESVVAPGRAIEPPLAARRRQAAVELKGYVQGQVDEADGTREAMLQRVRARYGAYL